MTKQEFIQRVAAKSGLSARDADKAVDAFLETVTDALKTRRLGQLHGFRQVLRGTPRRPAGREPAHRGARSQIAATTVPKFSAGSQLKAAVKGG